MQYLQVNSRKTLSLYLSCLIICNFESSQARARNSSGPVYTNMFSRRGGQFFQSTTCDHVTNLSIERTRHHVLLKALPCLRSPLARLRNHNVTDGDNLDFRSFRKISYSKHGKLMPCSGFVSSKAIK